MVSQAGGGLVDIRSLMFLRCASFTKESQTSEGLLGLALGGAGAGQIFDCLVGADSSVPF